MRLARTAVFLGVCIAAAACGPSRNADQDAGVDVQRADLVDRNRVGFDVDFVLDAGVPDDVTPVEAAIGSGGCNTLQFTAPAVPDLDRSGPMPTPTGGTLTNGSYVLTLSEVYGGAHGGGPGLTDGGLADADDVIDLDASDDALDASAADDGGDAGAIDDALDASAADDGGDAGSIDDMVGTTDAGIDAPTDNDVVALDAGGADAFDAFVPDISIPPQGPQRRGVLLLSGTSLYGLQQVDQNAAHTFNATVVPQGTALDIVIHCPAGYGFAPSGYDSNATTLVLYYQQQQRVETYTRE